MSVNEPPISPSAEAMVDAMISPGPDRLTVPRARWGLVALVLLCLLPRLGVAYRQSVICRDGVFYIQCAEALEAHDWRRGFQTLGLNVYPSLLAVFDHAGFDLPTTGKAWGIVVASLAVLPLFGWVRRLFDDRVAWIVALLYAAHPKLMEWSPELVRDPTFWLFWSTSIYCLVRAVGEVRLAWFILGGASIALAVHTRFEGWLLYLPWAAWTWHRSRHLVTDRLRLLRGAAAGLAVYPVLLLLVNVTVLHDCPEWQLGSFERLRYVHWWWQGATPESANWSPERIERVHAVADNPPASFQRPHLTKVSSEGLALIGQVERGVSWRFLLNYLDALRRGFDLGYALLAAWGIWRWRALWRRADYWALLAVAIAIFGAIWIHFWYAGATSSRYVLTVLLLALPWTALGLLDLIDQAVTRIETIWPNQPFSLRGVCIMAMTGWFAIGSARALTSRDLGLVREAALGRWLGSAFGAETPIALARTMPLCAYYAGPAQHVTWLDTRDASWAQQLEDRELTVAIVDAKASPSVASRTSNDDWVRFEPVNLPEDCRQGKFVVFVRRRALGVAIAAGSDLHGEEDQAAARWRKATVGR